MKTYCVLVFVLFLIKISSFENIIEKIEEPDRKCKIH